MINMIGNWYKRHFSNPDTMVLLAIIIFSFLFIYFFSNILMPVFVAISIAFLLDWPATKISQLGLSRTTSVTLVVLLFIGLSLLTILGLMPIIWQQGSNFVKEVPSMLSQAQTYLLTLPEKYPEFIDAEHLASIMVAINEKVLEWGELVISASLNSLSGLVTLLIYFILVPLMVFFFLKDKRQLVKAFLKFLPEERRLAKQVSDEMNLQIMNYIRGKVIEILIVGTVATIAFIALDLRYAVLLGVIVGLSVLIPYVGATIATFPVLLVALLQFGTSAEFGYVMIAYAIIQALDGNVLVPLLFSEAVSLHPVFIIIAVLFFGGLWGFWGVFFAIPLASLVKAIMTAWTSVQPHADIETNELTAQ